MKREYLVTIAMPIYNAALFVEKSLLSALNQTFPSIEYLLIDDKGQDGSMDIVTRVLNTHPRGGDVYIIDQVHNQKTGAARNAGIDNATGKYLLFMDSDDLLSLDCVEKLYNEMQKNPVDFVAGSINRISINGIAFKSELYQPVDKYISGDDISVAEYRYMYNGQIFPMSYNKLYSLSFLRENDIRCIPHFLIEDPWFTYQVLLCAKSCSLISDITYYYLVNDNSITSVRYSEINARQYAETQKLKCEYIKKWTETDVYPALLNDIMFMSVYNAYMIYDSAMKAIIDWRVADELCFDLLKRNFLLPRRISVNWCYMKCVLGIIVFSFPIRLKVIIIRMIVKLQLKQYVKRWLHF
ncbi:glycosyltransferase family 2 protein [uncultured Bacteroides sp.]|uniref:glycosyltransferase family 2 protein n=1 Tax=uncultured Bacteroides sp. TaxID=162156 RepID=UPI0025EE18AD|nr:glycosyltransferase family 2 protein [uncultured Bacteroides sp.]